MKPEYAELLKSKMDDASFEKIAAIDNDKVPGLHRPRDRAVRTGFGLGWG